MMKTFALTAVAAATLLGGTAAKATDLEVIHWWTSPGETAAVHQFRDAFNNDGAGDKWVDDAIADGNTARSTDMQRIQGGDPPGASQFNPGREYEELIKNNLLLDLTDLATAGNWEKIIRPHEISEGCLVDGHWWCVPVNIHSWNWGWYNKKVFADAGLPEPKNFQEFLADAPKLKANGVIPFAIGGDGGGWQIAGAFGVIQTEMLGKDKRAKILRDKDTDLAGGPEMKAVFAAFKSLRDFSDDGYANRNWNDTWKLVDSGKAALQIMGDWERGEFAAKGEVGTKDYGCIAGFDDAHPTATTSGDVFVFPKQNDPDKEAAQKRLANLIISPAVQLAFNNAKGSSPVRSDVDVASADPCLQKTLDIYNNHPDEVVTDVNRWLSNDTVNQMNDLFTKFFNDPSYTVDQAQADYVNILKNAN
ncbi:MAG TPA: ABC transporter substrate-binding protein [Devosia sp.]|nr:ABC transporter substrate-binding protein [Devosia sp.]